LVDFLCSENQKPLKVTFNSFKHLIGIVFIFLIGCEEVQKKQVKEAEITFKKEALLQLNSAKEVTIATFEVEIAANDYKRQTGLVYRTKLKPNQ
jgi:hypothetical protein